MIFPDEHMSDNDKITAEEVWRIFFVEYFKERPISEGTKEIFRQVFLSGIAGGLGMAAFTKASGDPCR